MKRKPAALALLFYISTSILAADEPRDRASFESAVNLFYMGEFTRAREAFETFTTLHPASPLCARVPYWLGAIGLKTRDFGSALGFFNVLGSDAASDPSFFARHSKLLSGVALEELGRDEEAETFYRGLLEDPNKGETAPEAAPAQGGARAAEPSRGTPRDWMAEAAFRLAGIQYRKGGLERARDLYSKIVIDFPDSSFVRDSLFFLAETELALGNTAAAEKRYVSLLSLYPGTPYKETASLRLAQTAGALGKTGESLALLEEFLAGGPGKALAASALRLKADLLFDRLEFAAAARSYRHALQAVEGGEQAQGISFELGISLLRAGYREQAADALKGAVEGASREITGMGLFRLGSLLADLGRGDEAAPVLERFCEEYPREPRREEAFRILASISARRKNAWEERKHMGSLVRHFPGSPRMPEYLYRKGLLSVELGEEEEALHDLQRILREFGDSPYRDQGTYAIGSVYAGKGEFIRALPYFRSIAGSEGAGLLAERTELAIGSCSFNLGAYPEALSCFEALLQNASRILPRGKLLLYSAMALYRMQRLDEAAARFQESSAQSGDDTAAEAFYWLGWCHFRQGRFAISKEAFLSIPGRFPSSMRAGEALLRAAVSAAQLGDDADAVKILDRVLSQTANGKDAAAGQNKAAETLPAPDEPGLEEKAAGLREMALYEKAWALRRIGRRDESEAVFARLEEEYPGGKLHAEALYKRAAQALERNLPRQAIEGFQRVMMSYPSSPLAEQALYWSADATLATGDAASSAELYWQYITRYSGGSLVPSALEGFERALRSGSIELAREFVQKSRTMEGLSADTLSSIELDCAGRLLTQNSEESRSLILSVLDRMPSERLKGKADFLLAGCFAVEGEWEKARAAYEELYDSRGDRLGARARMECARVLESAGKAEEAFDMYLSLHALFPGFSDLASEGLYRAVRLSRARGESVKASASEATLRKAYPDSPWIKRLEIDRLVR